MKKRGRPAGQFQEQLLKLHKLLLKICINNQTNVTTAWLAKALSRTNQQVSAYLKTLVAKGAIIIETKGPFMNLNKKHNNRFFHTRTIYVLPKVTNSVLDKQPIIDFVPATLSAEKAEQTRAYEWMIEKERQHQAELALFESMDPDKACLNFDAIAKELKLKRITQGIF